MYIIWSILKQLFHKDGGDKGRWLFIGLLFLFTLSLIPFTARPSLAANTNQISLKETTKSLDHLNVEFKQGFFPSMPKVALWEKSSLR